MTTRQILHATVASLSLIMPTVAFAQSESNGSGEVQDIVVTARKREESVKDVPLTVNALTQQQLEARQIRNVDDLLRVTASMNFTPGNSRASSSISVRGMTQTNPVGDNRRDIVTLFLDGVPIVGNPSVIGLDNITRVEVIKGPQSALFGRATFAGAISMTSETPGNEFGGRISGTIATYDDYRVSAGLNFPLIKDLLSLGIAGEMSRFGGFYDNALGGKLGKSDRNQGVVTLNFTPASNLSLKLRYSHRYDKDGEAASQLIARFPTFNCGPFPGFAPRSLAGLPASITTVGEARRLYCGPLTTPAAPYGINVVTPTNSNTGLTSALLPFLEHGLRVRHEIGTAGLNWSFANGFNFSATASLQRQQIQIVNDFERTAEDRYQGYINTIQRQTFAEARLLTPTDKWISAMIGASHIDQDFDTVGSFVFGTLFGPTAGNLTSNPNVLARNNSRNNAVFGSVTVNPVEGLSLIAEGRYQDEKLTSGIGTPNQVSASTKKFLPRLIVRYQPNTSTTVYFNYARGNQPTSTYAPFYALTTAGQTVAAANGVIGILPEARLDNFEIGLKYFSPDRRFFANLSAYYSKWVGRQGIRTVQVDINGDGIINLTGTGANLEVFNAVPFAAGDSNSRGIELEAGFRPIPELAIGGNVSWARTNITKALNEALLLRFLGLADGQGRIFPSVPEWSGSGFAEYTGKFGTDREWFLRGDVTMLGRRYDSILNTAYVPTLWRVNARTGVRFGRTEIALWVTNLFNDKTLESSSYNSDSAADPFSFQLSASEAVLPRKRQIGLTVSTRF